MVRNYKEVRMVMAFVLLIVLCWNGGVCHPSWQEGFDVGWRHSSSKLEVLFQKPLADQRHYCCVMRDSDKLSFLVKIFTDFCRGNIARSSGIVFNVFLPLYTRYSVACLPLKSCMNRLCHLQNQSHRLLILACVPQNDLTPVFLLIFTGGSGLHRRAERDPAELRSSCDG